MHEGGHGPVEARRDDARRDARAQVADDRREHGGRIGSQGASGARRVAAVLGHVQGEGVRGGVRGGRVHSGPLQLDGGLRLVPGPVAHPGE